MATEKRLDVKSSRIIDENVAKEPAPANNKVGPIIKRLRRRSGLTLEQLASLSGVSRAMLSNVERGEKNPTLPLLANIAAGLEVNMSELMGEQTPFVMASVTLRRSRLIYKDEQTGTERHLLSPTHLDNGMEIVEHFLPGGEIFEGQPHPGVLTSKCVIVTEGQLTLEIGNVVYTLDAEDSITFEASNEYRFKNNAQSLCRYYIFMLHQRA
jgi:transcriptional regulator with XRE-family HTH domain